METFSINTTERKSNAAPRRAKAQGGRAPEGTSRIRLSDKQRLPFLKALSGLISGGYPAGEALRLLKRRVKDPRLLIMVSGMWERVSAGATLSEAMSDWPRVFNGQIVSLIRAGEATGSLKEVLKRLIEHLTAAQLLRRKIINALSYPCLICVLASAMLVFFMLFLVPKLQSLLNSLGGKMPLSTLLLTNGAHFLVHFGPFALFLVVAVVFLFGRWWKTPQGRLWTDRSLLRMPLVGTLTIEVSIQSFSQTLGVLMENGITTIDALRIAERTVGNHALAHAFRLASCQVAEGQSLIRALARIPYVPDYVIDLLSVGENTGKLAPQLRDLAESMQEELSQRLKTVTATISTTVLMAAFAFVGFIAYAVVSALLQVSGSFKL